MVEQADLDGSGMIDYEAFVKHLVGPRPLSVAVSELSIVSKKRVVLTPPSWQDSRQLMAGQGLDSV